MLKVEFALDDSRDERRVMEDGRQIMLVINCQGWNRWSILTQKQKYGRGTSDEKC